MAGIDWDFISQKGVEGESTHTTGYVPTLGSGFTVGSVDVGQHSREDIRSMLQGYANKLAGGGRGSNVAGNIRKDLLSRLEPYTKDRNIGKIWESYGSREGYDLLAKTEKFEKEDIEYITKAKRYSFEDKLGGKKGWNKLDEKTQTILGSVGWQYGLDSSVFDTLWSKKGNKEEMAKYLRGLDEYKYRRNIEADYLSPLSSVENAVMEEDRRGNIE